MKLPTRHKSPEGLPGVSGVARVDRRTHAVVSRVQTGDIAVIDHLDLDRATAQSLLDRGVAAVVNAGPFISGRYPNLGPELLVRSGVVLVDQVGREALTAVKDGAQVRLDGGTLYVEDAAVAEGHELDADDVATQMEGARSGLTSQLESFTHNAAEFLRREQDVLLHGLGAPELKAQVAGRPVVVVVRGYDYVEDLRRLRRYIREQRPVLIGVDSGADALLAAHHRPDVLVIGEDGLAPAESENRRAGVSDKALKQSREVVLHTDRSGRGAREDRLERLGIRSQEFASGGTTEDVALLLADLNRASLIVTVGTHATLDEFLDRQRSGQASTFLTRLRVGPNLVQARAVPTLYSGRVRIWHLLLVLLAGVVALCVALAATPIGNEWWLDLKDALTALFDS